MTRTARNSLKLSFEFFPPGTEAAQRQLDAAVERLRQLRPDYFSVTFGAGGGSRRKTFETALAVREATGIDTAPHISCVGADEEELEKVLRGYQDQGFTRLVALRGDLPSGIAGGGALRHACDLVKFIRRQTGDLFHLEVACYPEFHPQAAGARQDLEYFKQKADAGADGAITQYFYNPDAYFRFLESCARLGVDIPIVPGVMPITNRDQLVRFSNACGAEIPRWILQRLYDLGDDLDAVRDFGTDVAVRLCGQLLDGGAPGLHIYTMNRPAAAEAVWDALGLL